MKATIYIPDDQAKIYEYAKEKLGESISKTFVKCLERELRNARLKLGRIVFDLYDEKTDRVQKKSFEGRFIVGTENQPEKFLFDEEVEGMRGGGGYAVAVTKGGRLAVFTFDNHQEQIVRFTKYEDFDEFKNAEMDNRYPMYPESLVQAVASEVGIERIEDMDI